MELSEYVFQIILRGGNARSFAMEAIAYAKKGNFQEAWQALDNAGNELNEAHSIQTSLIQKEAAGDKTEISLLMVHAQDHLMNALTVRDLAKEFVQLYTRLSAEQGEKQWMD
ncbi:PTS lactose/cellobiose transporter subunit IIA [Brevibacillus fulvus]|uniref:PTS system cellobiose-specific IIA component n=1 Tax=Brevibacillus fulvus TaxID=1125967 RepID=A0A938XZ42_9BACL|nr:PTS lactose/cellobiose transporter subunit IIA [Brevibacillus fulvus]MBM7590345.1 PTS system cellobiose-specific IIA component [Brevibacillus fulvus]